MNEGARLIDSHELLRLYPALAGKGKNKFYRLQWLTRIRAPPSVSYQERGDYYYAFFRYVDKVHTVYVGKEKREIDPLKELQKKNRKNPIEGGSSKMGTVFARGNSWVIEYRLPDWRIRREANEVCSPECIIENRSRRSNDLNFRPTF